MGVLTLSVPVTFKYLDRSEAFTKSLTGTEALLIRLRQILGDDLKRRIDALLAPTPSLVLTAAGERYTERAANPTTTEAYRQQLHEFVTGNSVVLLAYRRSLSARNGWTRWARVASWSALLLSGWEIVAAFALAFALKVKNLPLSDGLLIYSFLPTVLAIMGLLLGLGLASVHHDTIIQLKTEHEPL